ncbi:SAM-dependent methyltransferase [Streptosporangium nondiastaticum]|uniref:SAM-dependent methyltransferase n=1 Tax=Streptosporangium nondiastaticum TaxID=35764 RepID=A0A9X7JS10_9ACTN|nr:class I SAM-dependent methyltransferase [Streptosporangium nondiastaticum]PSJ28802.1 SAM-dependent methyltransferase [Streptosporangium nondiastaticum]
MPTSPSGRSSPSDREPHQHRETAESFGTDAERYDRARPRYPGALVERIAAGAGDVLDVGCGTGIAARQFQAAGCRVLGVEPDPRMAALARQLGVDVDVSAFEAWDPAGRAFDAVVAAQAWHWIDPVAGAAKAAQALRTGGRLAAFWNVPRLPPEVTEAFDAAYRRVAPDSPFAIPATEAQALDGHRQLEAKAADAIRESGGFGEPEQWRFDWDRTYTRDAWLDQMPTHGSLTRLPPGKAADVLEHVGAAIDAMGGSFAVRYATVAVTAVRTGAA